MTVAINQIAERLFLIMGKFSALAMDLHAVLAFMNKDRNFNVKRTSHLIGTLKNVKKMTLEVAASFDPVIKSLETHNAELASEIFQQKPPSGTN